MERDVTERRLLRVSEVAQMLDVSPARIYELARSGRIPSVRLGRQVRVGSRQGAAGPAALGEPRAAFTGFAA